MQIGDLQINGFASLAPMAGVADRAFRELCVGYGAGYVTTEMVSAKGITMGDRKSKQLLFMSEAEQPAGAQIFGCEPRTMAKAVESVLEFGPKFIDINMGCPAPKIAGNGSGSALMKNPPLCGEIVRAVVSASPVPVTAKIRAGWDENSLNAAEVAKYIEDAGASAITVHGRTRTQMYAPPVDMETIAAVKRAVKIPVIGNGDVYDVQTAAILRENTGCDYLAVGRGALGRPWLFSQINAYLNEGRVLPEPPVSERMRVMLAHIQKLCEYKGDKIGMQEARKHAAWYTKGLKGAAKYRQEIMSLTEISKLREIAFRIAVENS